MSDRSREALAELEHAYNLRDLGGAMTVDRRRVRHGLLFRSAALCEIDDRERALFEAMGLALLIDLRTSAERAHAPTAIPVRAWSRDYGGSGGEIHTIWRQPDLTPQGARALMLDVYRAMPDEQAAAYAELLRRIADGDLPLLFHCTAGKDRTGVAAALLLDLLGVPREAIEADYLRTRTTLRHGLARVRAALVEMGLPRWSDAVLEPVLGVEPDYIEAMFRSVEQSCGSVAGYARNRLGMGEEAIARLRDRLLTPPTND
ncbi:tyrosine-protein phosphatase [Sphingomonas solaris]|uniref:protein-tyrosine-phosphatase n=1 Tax=Alterirhizorhabdus solaris TaxID=2529389 RepID=A0A558R8Z1_9SPHN|nr:tyrosine-protein phosphatase [Sphingomonas solaris]TVV75836.1 tyrosine-protein phosphatase [Sphingomonas solaris]